MTISKGGIAFFDSGIGGLTVLDACQRLVPDTIFYYYGDNAYAPYGNLSPSIISARVDEAFCAFRALNARACVLACNTVTALCVDRLRKENEFPIIGVEPALFPALKLGVRVAVLCTKATRESERFRELCLRAQKEYPSAKILLPECDELAGVIERGILSGGLEVTPYLPRVETDVVVLGCTHYTYAKPQIQSFYQCPVVDGNLAIARRLVQVLEEGRDMQPLVTPNPLERVKPPINDIVSAEKIGRVYFIGTGKSKNKAIYEQMFAIP